MGSFTRLKKLTGVDAGLEYVAYPIDCAFTLDQCKSWQGRDYKKATDADFKRWADETRQCEVAGNTYNGYWIDGIGRVEIGTDWENLCIPLDKMDREIKVGDVVVYAMRDLVVSEMKITKLEKKGYGTMMYGIDLHTNKNTKNSYPRRCLKVSP